MSVLFYSFITLQLFLVAWLDVKKHTISNYWVIANFLISPVLYLALPESYDFAWELFIFPVGFIAIGFLFFLMGIMGAGDSKYIASLFMVIPENLHMVFFDGLLYGTLLVGSLMLGFRIIQRQKELRAYLMAQYWQGIKDIIKSRFSYAPVIFLAWIYLGVRQWS